MRKEVWLRRPGIASDLTPRAGTAQEWRTSSAVMRIRAAVPMGVTIRLSTSNRRKWPGSRSFVGVM